MRTAVCLCRQTAVQITMSTSSGRGQPRLWTDGNTILDVVEHVLRHHVLGYELALYPIGTVAHNTFGHILGDTQRENQIG